MRKGALLPMSDGGARSGRGALPAGLILLALCLLGTSPAYAYVDPTSGSIALQAIIAVAAGAAVVIRGWYASIVQFFRREKKNNDPCPSENSEN